VGLQLLIIAGKSDIEEILVFAELTERAADVGLEVIPPKAELLLEPMLLNVEPPPRELFRILSFQENSQN